MKEAVIKALAGIVLLMLGFLFLTEPFLIGKERRLNKPENHTVADWVSTWVSIAIFLPICGRVLGWW